MRVHFCSPGDAREEALGLTSSFRSIERYVFLIVASSKYKPVNDRLVPKLNNLLFDLTLKEFIVKKPSFDHS